MYFEVFQLKLKSFYSEQKALANLNDEWTEIHKPVAGIVSLRCRFHSVVPRQMRGPGVKWIMKFRRYLPCRSNPSPTICVPSFFFRG